MARQRLTRKSQDPQELLRKALRYETSLKQTLAENPYLFEEEYEITWDDVYALLNNLKEKDPTADELFEEWADPFQEATYDIFQYSDSLYDDPEDIEDYGRRSGHQASNAGTRLLWRQKGGCSDC